MRTMISGGLAAAAFGLAMAAASPASAQMSYSQPLAAAAAASGNVTEVQFRGGRGGFRGGGGFRGYRGGGYRGGYRRGGYGGAGLGIGLAAGALLGGAIAAQSAPRYYAPGAYYGGGDADAYCLSRFKSYDPASGTYLGYDGLRHPCP